LEKCVTPPAITTTEISASHFIITAQMNAKTTLMKRR